MVSRRRPGTLAEIGRDLERTEPQSATLVAPIEHELDPGPETDGAIEPAAPPVPAPAAAMAEPARAS